MFCDSEQLDSSALEYTNTVEVRVTGRIFEPTILSVGKFLFPVTCTVAEVLLLCLRNLVNVSVMLYAASWTCQSSNHMKQHIKCVVRINCLLGAIQCGPCVGTHIIVCFENKLFTKINVHYSSNETGTGISSRWQKITRETCEGRGHTRMSSGALRHTLMSRLYL